MQLQDDSFTQKQLHAALTQSYTPGLSVAESSMYCPPQALSYPATQKTTRLRVVLH